MSEFGDLSPEDQEKSISLQEEIHALLHAMQTGVAYTLEKDNTSGTPKHLRVGINAAMSDHGALIRLLMKKGIITELEYFEAIRDGLKNEVDSYEKALSARYGINIKLG